MLNLIALSAAVVSQSSAYPSQEVFLAFEQACGELVAPPIASSLATANGWSRVNVDTPNSEKSATFGIMKAGASFPGQTISNVQIFTRQIAGRPLFLMYYEKKPLTESSNAANVSNECKMFDFNTDLSLSRYQVERWMNHPPDSQVLGNKGMWRLIWLPGRTQSQSILSITYYPTSSGYVQRSIEFSASDNPALRITKKH